MTPTVRDSLEEYDDIAIAMKRIAALEAGLREACEGWTNSPHPAHVDKTITRLRQLAEGKA